MRMVKYIVICYNFPMWANIWKWLISDKPSDTNVQTLFVLTFVKKLYTNQKGKVFFSDAQVCPSQKFLPICLRALFYKSQFFRSADSVINPTIKIGVGSQCIEGCTVSLVEIYRNNETLLAKKCRKWTCSTKDYVNDVLPELT